ncbi:MAG TPA: hypothetical protein VHZ77_01575 [Gaiellaceae bacterium]|jgi:hypothetical protein|nr:hypothetical protein [Gaiellaceae bacterium]
MDRRLGLSLPAAALLVLAGCGSGSKTEPLVFTKKTTTTLASPTAGEPVRCLKVHAKIPPEGASIAVSGKGSSSSTKLQLTRQSDGSLIISCKP